MNDDEVIYQIARQIDPQVFDHEGTQPPTNFFGSPEWWAVARNSRIKRATEAATAALKAVHALNMAMVPHAATPAMILAGSTCLTPDEAPTEDSKQKAQNLWEAMLAATHPEETR